MSDAIRPRRWGWLTLAGVLLLALALRVYRLDAQSLWNDEGTSVALAGRDLASITRQAAHDIHPPLYYYLLHGWVRLAGTSERAVRGLSALAGVALVGATYALARRRLGRVQAVAAGLLSALSPFQVYYAQEARMYIFVALWGCLSLLAYDAIQRALDQPWRRWIGPVLGYLLATWAALYSHYFALALLAVHNAGILLWLLIECKEIGWGRTRRRAGMWALVQVIVALGYLPWVGHAVRSLGGWPSVSARLSSGELALSLARVLPLGITSGAGPWATALGLALAALVLVGCVSAFWRGRAAERRHALWQTVLYAFIPVLALVAASLRRPMYNWKFLLLATPGYLLLVAEGLSTLANGAAALAGRWGRSARAAVWLLLLAAACAAMLPSLRNLYYDPAYRRDDYRGILAAIQAAALPDDAILINAPSQIETITYYYQGALPLIPLPLKRPPDRSDTEDELAALAAQHGRIWAIYWATDESDPKGIVEGWLDRHAFKALDRWYGNVRLALYATSQEGQAMQPMDAVLGDAVRLRGYTLHTPAPASGDILQLTLYWEALRPLSARYKVFTHLMDARDHLVAQRDDEPVAGARPTTTWQVGELIADNYGLSIAAGAPSGPHRLIVGLYSFDDGQRLPVTTGLSPFPNAVLLTALDLARAPSPPSIEALDLDARTDLRWGGLELLGYSLYPLGQRYAPDAALMPGQPAELLLFWRKTNMGEAPGAWMVRLEGRGAAWEQSLSLVGGDYPVADWQVGEVVRDIQHLVPKADLPAGSYRLELGPEEGELRTLGKITLGKVTLGP